MGKNESIENGYVRRALTLDAVESLAVAPQPQQQNVASTRRQQRYPPRERNNTNTNNKELQQNDANINDCFNKGAFYAAVKRKLTLTQTNVEKVIKQQDKELFNHMKSLTDKQRTKRLSEVPKKYFNEYDEFMKKGAALPLDQRATLSNLVSKICEGVDKSGEWRISSEHLNEIHSWWCDHIDSNTNAADRVLPLIYVSNDPTRKAVGIAFGSGFSATENRNASKKGKVEATEALERGGVRGDVEDLEEQVKALDGKVKELEAKNQSLEETNVSVRGDWVNMANQNDQNAATIEVLKEQIVEKEKAIEELRTVNDEKNKELMSKIDEIAENLVSLFIGMRAFYCHHNLRLTLYFVLALSCTIRMKQ